MESFRGFGANQIFVERRKIRYEEGQELVPEWRTQGKEGQEFRIFMNVIWWSLRTIFLSGDVAKVWAIELNDDNKPVQIYQSFNNVLYLIWNKQNDFSSLWLKLRQFM